MDDLKYLPLIGGCIVFISVMVVAIYLEVTKDKR